MADDIVPIKELDRSDFGQPNSHIHLSFTPRVLLAEDCADTKMILTNLLEKIGAEVTTVTNGELCVEEVRRSMEEERPFDIVLIDIRMPRMNGHEAARKLRSLGWEKPLIAITMRPCLSERHACIHSGFDHFLAKATLANTIVPALDLFLGTHYVGAD